MRTLSYVEALNETLHQQMSANPDILLIGQGVDSPWYAGNSTVGLFDRFGAHRVIDTPVSENAITGAGVGAALAGLRPIVFHARMDFMVYAMDAIINQAGNWHFMFGGRVKVPMTIWAVINRGGEQGAQHSQALHAMFAHAPGVKVVMPSTPYDVKGLLNASINDPNPVMFVDERWLYHTTGGVPEEMYEVRIGTGVIRRPGTDVTVVATSFMVGLSLTAAEEAERFGVSVEVVDLRTLKPLDKSLILQSVAKTGRLVVADGGWRSFGASAEISATVSEDLFDLLKAPIERVALPDMPAPASRVLEQTYYPTSAAILRAIHRTIEARAEQGVPARF